MAQANADNTTNAPTSELGLQQQLKAAGMRLQRLDNDHYSILFRNQEVCRGLSLLGAARFIDKALNR